MTDPDGDPHDLRPHLEHFWTTIFLIRNERRDGHAFSRFEALFCDQYENYQEGIRMAMNVRMVVDVAATVHKHMTRWQRK